MRVGHKIIEINGESIVAVSHDKIVSLLANAVGEVRITVISTVEVDIWCFARKNFSYGSFIKCFYEIVFLTHYRPTETSRIYDYKFV